MTNEFWPRREDNQYRHEFYQDAPEAYSMPASGGAIDFRKMLNALWRSKLFLAFAAVLSAALVQLLFINEQPRYTAATRVLFDPERVQIVDIQDVVAEQDASGSGLGNQIEILTSSVLLQRVIDDLDLTRHPVYQPGAARSEDFDVAAIPAKARELMDKAISRLRGDVEITVGTPPEPGVATSPVVESPAIDAMDSGEIVPVSRETLERRLISGLDLTPIPGTRVILIEYTSTDRRHAADVANAIARNYITVQADVKQDDLAASLELIGVRVEELREKLEGSQNAVEEARMTFSQEQGQSVEVTELQLSAFNGSLAQLQLQIATTGRSLQRARTALDQDTDLWIVEDFRANPLIGEFRRTEIALLDELAGIDAIAGPQGSSRERAIIQARLEEVRRNTRTEASYVVDALDFTLDSLRQQEEELLRMIGDLEVITIRQTAGELTIDRLQREAIANQTLYESFLNRMNEISEQAELQTADARIISAAKVPQWANRTLRETAGIAAAGAGLLLAALFVLVRERISNAFHDPTDLQAETGLPTIAAIPQLSRRKNTKQLIASYLNEPNGVLAEAVRNLRTSVLFSDPKKRPKVIMCTSSVPAEGKSGTSMLLGVASQGLGQSAIVVGCDLRKHPYSSLLGYSKRVRSRKPGDNSAGLMTLLTGECSLDEAVYVEPESGLHVLAHLPSEPVVASPADIVASERFVELIEELRRKYDIVILDTPPAIAVTDARLVGRVADAVIYLVKWDATSRNAVRVGLREIRSLDARLVGCAMTLVPQRRASKYSDNEFYYKVKYHNS
ncbi:MAG: Wzz/FepE/Etk N-terminal domain-containing protein [Pseudomonadota bacterium]